MHVRNIYCVGWNYRRHAQELQNEVRARRSVSVRSPAVTG
ncbi:2-keto-4-pentenoate hydratase/2-oxohepta-3-ene-1,7-dioic acid hydratase in catechol pathway [Heliobacterium gestii]|nr:2-keto-4-pentenoate hydratase/2-oxohepta-3-ene-1,7-dioic acid hydratase in catechol pathway [Heliomicrobium gestii]